MNLEPSRFFAFRKHLRVSNPPGGVSNIFSPTDQCDSPRKVKDHQKSSIFSGDEQDGAKRNFSSPRYQQDTKQRLFGEVDVGASPRRVTDTWRSNVLFSASADCLSDELKRTPKRSPSAGINPITGEVLVNNGNQEENGASPIHTNGVKNGESEENDSAKQNGENGHQNGQLKNGDAAEKKAVSSRQPPGGKSSGIFG